MLVEATGVIDAGDGTSRSAYAKINRRILLPLAVCFMLAFIDRVNVGFAYLHMKDDVGLDTAAYGLGVGLFFVSYTLFEVPSNLLLTRIGARKTIARIMILWGVISAATMFVQTPAQFFIARLALGAAEAGFFPGAMLILTYWYPSQRRARAIALFSLAVPAAGIVGSPLSGWIMYSLNDVGGLHDWQWMFLIEGTLPVIAGVTMFFLLTDTPAKAGWLTDPERSVVVGTLETEQQAKGVADETHRFGAALKSPLLYIAALAYFPVAWVGSVLNYWAPQILKQVGVGSVANIGLLLVIPSAVGAIGMLIVCRSSDRRMERRWHWAISALVSAAAILCLTQVGTNLLAAMITLCVINIGYLCIAALYFTIPSAFLSGSAAAGGLALVSAMGQVGGFLAPLAIGHVKQSTGSFSLAFVLVAVLLLIAAFMVIRLIPVGVFPRPAQPAA